MPREVKPWHGKVPLDAPALRPAETPPPSTPSVEIPVENPVEQAEPPESTRPLCPQCGEHALRKLASGAWGCAACATVFRLVAGGETQVEPIGQTDQDDTADEAPEALDSIEAINRMLLRNTLTLGTGGVPLAQTHAEADSPRARNGRRRNRRRS